jgi:long-chain acyl-CoA synthetase
MLVAMVYPAWEQVQKEGKSKDDLQKIMNDNLSALNKQIPYYCKVSEIRLREHAFEKTPKLSIRRFLYQNQTD